MTDPLANRYRVVDEYSTGYFATFEEALVAARNALLIHESVTLRGPADTHDGLTLSERAKWQGVRCEVRR
jgi:hypothetical protein